MRPTSGHTAMNESRAGAWVYFNLCCLLAANFNNKKDIPNIWICPIMTKKLPTPALSVSGSKGRNRSCIPSQPAAASSLLKYSILFQVFDRSIAHFPEFASPVRKNLREVPGSEF
jgi:hypothetical protein